METKLTVAVFFGGQSSEHDISCVSAKTVIDAIDKEKYDVVQIGITKDGRWLKAESSEALADGSWKDSDTTAILSPEADEKCIIYIKDGVITGKKHVDVAFPVLHGLYGEDGTIQGIFELAHIPYVGCGVLASAVSMDKAYTKIIVDTLNIRQARYVVINHTDMDDLDKCADRVEEKLEYPVFVKPSRAGSSCGVSKAENREALKTALIEALKVDKRILVEETIIGREVECAVLGGYDPKASKVGEILAADEFYTFDAKYNNADSKTTTTPVLPDGKLEEIRKDAVAIFRAVDGFGLSRVDFFLEKGTNEVVFNEINTLPGFTSISMYPMLWADMGYDKKALTTKLIESAFER